MSSAKELLEQATPGPWDTNAPDGGAVASTFRDGRWLSGLGTFHDPANAALAVYAVNRLPDYEAMADALARLLSAEVLYTVDTVRNRPQYVEAIAEARAALVRLREVPA